MDLTPPQLGDPIPNAAIPTAGQGLVLGLNGKIDPSIIGVAPPQKYGTLIDVASSVTETDLLQAAGYAIPGNTLGANGVARITMFGDMLYNNNNTNNIRLRVYFGTGAAIWDGGNNNGFTLSAVRHGFWAQLILANTAVNAQALGGFMSLGYIGAPTTGIAGFSPGNDTFQNNQWFDSPEATAAVDTTAAQTLRVTAQWGTSSANNSFRVRHSLIEFI